MFILRGEGFNPRGAMPATFTAVLCLSTLAVLPTAHADQVVANQTSHTDASIVGFGDGRLRFRSADGALQSVWIDQVDLLFVDRGGAFADLNEAERYLATGELEKAAVRYRRALAITVDFWSDLATARLLAVLDQIGKIDRTAMQFIRLLGRDGAGAAAAARLIPQNMPARQDGKSARALGQLDAAIRKKSAEAQQVVLRLVRYELLRRTGDQRADGEATRVAAMVIPDSIRTGRVYAIVLRAMETALNGQVQPAVLEGLDRAILDCPEEHVASFLLLKGQDLLRSALVKEEIIRASWPFLRVVAHMPDDPRAIDGLFGAAIALERLGSPEKAIQLLEECLAHEQMNDPARGRVKTMLKRLRSGGVEPE